MKSIAIKNAFPGGAHGACWIDDKRIASAGADGTVKVVSLLRVECVGRGGRALTGCSLQHTITRVAA